MGIIIRLLANGSRNMFTSRTPARRLGVCVLLSVAVLALSACATESTPDAAAEEVAVADEGAVATTAAPTTTVAEPGADPITERITVVATTTILGDIARNIVGGDGTVEVLFAIGADPHDFVPSSAQVAAIHEADLVIATGLGLEEGLVGVLAAAVIDGVNIVEVADLVNPVAFSDRALSSEDEAGDHDHGEHDHGEHDGHDHGDYDPHVWFDPARVASIAQIVASELDLIDASIDWQTRAEEYSAAVFEADQEIVEILAVIPDDRRILVTNHESHGYFADRYGFEVIGTVLTGDAHLAEPSSADLAKLVAIINETGVRAIFAETTEPTALADAVAREADHPVEVVRLYSGSLGELGSEAETLIGMLKANAQLIADALS